MSPRGLQEFGLCWPKSNSSPCQRGRASQGSSELSQSWAASTGGFVLLSWSDRFHRGVGWVGGTGCAAGWWLPLPPDSSHIPALLFVHCKPQSPTAPQTQSWARSSPFLMFLFVPLQGQPGPEGSPGAKGYPGRQVQYMASGSSVAMVVWRWPRVPPTPGRGRRQAGG